MTNFHSAASMSSIIDPSLVEAVHEAFAQTIAMFAGAELTPKPVDEIDRLCDSICGTISFVGDRNFSAMICCSRESAAELSMAMAGFEIDYDSADMGDAIGEVVNIVAGDIVARMETVGFEVAMSLPTVFRGHDIERVVAHNTLSSCAVYDLSQSQFWVEIVTGQAASPHHNLEVCPACGR
ncbi:chemotaxis protein CheX [Armatimonas sp.]|uniref:chemotaxis protein CheX n=1 Tax=Armatimonas sp. TaxID=1872638 RepID=UPI00286CFFC0|nr:chemotaxis protein CheX [Armatimonas sp.]